MHNMGHCITCSELRMWFWFSCLDMDMHQGNLNLMNSQELRGTALNLKKQVAGRCEWHEGVNSHFLLNSLIYEVRLISGITWENLSPSLLESQSRSRSHEFNGGYIHAWQCMMTTPVFTNSWRFFELAFWITDMSRVNLLPKLDREGLK
jgi:hypothetical protein